MPCSVATMNVRACLCFSTADSIAVVEQTSSAISSTSARHSGCAMTTDSGLADFTRVTLAERSTSWIGQQPSYTTISFSGTLDATQLPRFLSGVKRILFWGSERTTEAAFALVQQMSESAFTSAVEFT